ncbi:MAG: excinuclease ABC subunit UvrC [Candidatus Chaera renei]|uniref:Excinuclease ABC subunit UvrC n=1 Tax=Candidatus Chaera renei TaxID=2506947 RepID=A0A4Q0AJZ7_9BACT|nr:MAG: excinuclease ABC subunit UvrC [Candidatus Chaera renei]
MKKPSAIQERLKRLPDGPGVYFFKSASGEIIYVGKAAVLKNRVRQYFQAARPHDLKTAALVAEIAGIDWMTTETEADALFVEGEQIRRYKPRYNILLRDDKSQIYVRLPMREAYPALGFTRYPLDDGARYFGPYQNGRAVRRALQLLRRVFPYSTHQVMPGRLCLHYHLGLCPGVEAQKISSSRYKASLRKLMRYLQGERSQLMRELKAEMQAAASARRYENAAKARDKLRSLKQLQNQVVFSDQEFLDISKDHALAELTRLLGLTAPPRRIEGYDISHIQGSDNTASMVVATNGLIDKSQYRKFKLKIPGNDDFAHMKEVLTRRFGAGHGDWPLPDLILIDGGKGQLGAAIEALEGRHLSLPVIGLAKRSEQIIVHASRSGVKFTPRNLKPAAGGERPLVAKSGDFWLVNLPLSAHSVKLLQRVRDESHRFAVSYHSSLRRVRQTAGALDGVPGIGPATKRRLIAAFGSGRAAAAASYQQMAAVVGEAKARRIFPRLHSQNP